MIFNVFAGLQVAVVAIPAGLVYAVAHYGLGWGNASFLAAITGTLCLIPVDVLSRFAAIGGDEGEEEGEGFMAFVKPNAGGHLMFVPTYVLGMVFTAGLAMGVFRP